MFYPKPLISKQQLIIGGTLDEHKINKGFRDSRVSNLKTDTGKFGAF